MAKAKSAAAAIIESVRANPTTRGPQMWHAFLSPENRAIMDDLAAKWSAGELAGMQLSDLHRAFKSATGVKVNYTSFCRTIKGERS